MTAHGRKADPTIHGTRYILLKLPYWLWYRVYHQAQAERTQIHEELRGGNTPVVDSMRGTISGVVRRLIADAFPHFVPGEEAAD